MYKVAGFALKTTECVRTNAVPIMLRPSLRTMVVTAKTAWTFVKIVESATVLSAVTYF